MRYGQYKPKLTVETASQRGWKPLEVDHMPASVATDLLCTLERLNNPQRKMYLHTRSFFWTAAGEPKPREKKMAHKFKESSMSQLGKWQHRATARRRTLQFRYEKAQGMPEENNLQAMRKQHVIGALEFAAGMLDQALEALELEITSRK